MTQKSGVQVNRLIYSTLCQGFLATATAESMNLCSGKSDPCVNELV